MKSDIKKQKIFLIIVALLFSLGISNVYAKCSDYSNGYNNLKACSSKNEDGFACAVTGTGSQTAKCYKTNSCAKGYVASGGKCINSNNSRVQHWYNCGGTCHKYYNYEKENNKSCSSTQYSSETACKTAASNNSRVQYWYNCGGTCHKYYNYEKNNNKSCNDTRYSSEANCKASLKSKTNSSGSKSSGSTSSSTVNTVSKYEILFDQNYGYGLQCDGVTSYKMDGVCAGTVSSGTEVNFPTSSKDMYRNGQGLLMGWSRSPNCVKGEIVDYKEKINVKSNIDYYACYRETIGGYRYIAEGAVADGGADVSCGTKYWIEYCNKETDGDFCYYIEPGTTDNYRKVYRNKLSDSYPVCNNTSTKSNSNTEETSDKGWRYPADKGTDFACGEALYITTCTDTECNYTKISKYEVGEVSKDGVVDRSILKESSDVAGKECESKKSETTVDENQKKCINSSITNMRKKSTYTICYNSNDSESTIKERLEKYYVCDTKAGYYFDRTSVVANGSADCNSNGICKRTYSVSCIKSKSDVRPTMSVTSGVVGSNGYGIIKVTANAKEGKIDSYFVSDYYTTPTESSKWIKLNGNSFEIESSPGIKYIWVRDSKGNISYAVSGAVIDTNNSKTTVKKLELYDASGHVQTPSRTVSYNTKDIKDAKYVKLSNDISKDSEILADGFNPFDMEYKLEVSSPTVTVYATLTSSDSKYVDGFEPRTVNLKYGINTVLIKIQDKEGKIRTYTILVTRVDDRTSDNTLSNIELSVGKISFNSNVTDYKIEIPAKTNSLNVNATISSDKASYVAGYEPGEISINDDTTVKLIKVMSETGSTRTYVLTFVKEGTDYIDDESLQFRDLVIPGVYIPFESEIVNYSLSVDYETESIDINPVLNDENGYYEIYIKNNINNDYIVTSNTGIGLEVGENFIEIKVVNSEGVVSYYRLTVIRKEFGLDVSGDTTLKDLKVLGYNINFKPQKKEYTVRIKQEKSLVITAVPNSNRAEVFIRGNDELTGFSTVRVKVVAENGEFDTYSIDIKKDAFNKTIEIASIILGGVIILVSSCIIVLRKKNRARREYFEE